MDYSYLYKQVENSSLNPWLDTLPAQVEKVLNSSRWGDLPKWKGVVDNLPHVRPSKIDLNSPYITIGDKMDCDASTRKKIEELLRELHPWRKGPFNVFGITIDTEWRSDLKWNRLDQHIQPLKDRLVLDVGCGNGYHCWRMAAKDTKLVVGIDPTMLYVMQFHAFQKYVDKREACVLPVGIDDMPDQLNSFDSVFSLGLLYHRRSPLDHLLKLKSFLREGGELILETLVIEGGKGDVLCPQGRYAKMPNVWFLPSPLTLESWLERMGLVNIRCVDVTKTTSEEQRVTDWMGFQSLSDFLDPNDPNRTIEGYPAPQRAIFLADNP